MFQSCNIYHKEALKIIWINMVYMHKNNQILLIFQLGNHFISWSLLAFLEVKF